MNVAIFSKYIIGLGLIVALAGGYVVKQATAEYHLDRNAVIKISGTHARYDSADILVLSGSERRIAEESGFLPSMEAADRRRTNGWYVVLAGGVVLFLGLALSISAPIPKKAVA